MKQLLLLFWLCALAQLAAAQPCAFYLTSQKQVDAVAASGCTTAESLAIYGGRASDPNPDKITDLTPLSGITAVNGNVVLNLYDVTNLQGLANIRTIGGNMTIGSATSAVELGIHSFQSLESIGGDLTIYDSDGITAIEGFPLLRTVRNFTITRNRALGVLTGFNALRTTALFSISECAALRSISGFANLTNLVPPSSREPSQFNINNNPAL
jgi:hypothetical protein